MTFVVKLILRVMGLLILGAVCWAVSLGAHGIDVLLALLRFGGLWLATTLALVLAGAAWFVPRSAPRLATAPAKPPQREVHYHCESASHSDLVDACCYCPGSNKLLCAFCARSHSCNTDHVPPGCAPVYRLRKESTA